MAEKTTEKLTACCECRHLNYECDHTPFCSCPGVFCFDPIAGEWNDTISDCATVNTDGHCPHFEAKQ